MKLGYLFTFFIYAIFLSHSVVKAQEPVAPNGKFIDANGAKIYIEEYGQGEPLILLHGFGRTLEDWKPYIPEFSKRYRVIAWDMRGHGRSIDEHRFRRKAFSYEAKYGRYVYIYLPKCAK